MSIAHIILFSGKIKRTSRTFKLKSDELTYKGPGAFVIAPVPGDTVFILHSHKTEHSHFLKNISASRSKM